MDETFSPTFHRLNQAIRHRAVHPDSEVPPPFETILKPSHPPEELLERASKHLERLKAVADVKKVPPKTAFRKQKRQIEAPRSGLDVTELLQSHKKDSQAQQGTFVSPQNAIPDFRRILDTEEEIPEIQSAFLQLAKIIEGWVKDSFGDSKYEHAIEALGAMREQSIEMDEPGWYNDWLKDFKSKLFSEKLGGDRKEMWWKVRRSRLGLVDSKASEKSEVDEAAAKEFMSSR